MLQRHDSELMLVHVDMHLQKHLNATGQPDRWPRGGSAWLDRECVWCQLDYGRGYHLMDAYRQEPHVRFLNAKSDDDLLAFVGTWGPLAIPDGSPEDKSVLRIGDYRLFQRKLEALSDLFHAVQNARGERKALVDFLAAEREGAKNFDLSALTTLCAVARESSDAAAQQLAQTTARLLTQESSDSKAALKMWTEWIVHAPAPSVRRAGASLIEKLYDFSARVSIDPQSRRASFVWDINNLEDALVWMVCQDALDERLPQICPECRETFKPAFRHKRKFCSPGCAQRCAAREWARRNRRQKQKRRRKPKAS